MNATLERCLRRVLSLPAIATLPTRVRRGVAAGAAWTCFPYSAYWRGTHEPEAQQAVEGLMDWTGKSVWDLGSHFGLFAVGLGRRVGPTGYVAAFEPFPENFARLALHIRRNRLDWVHPFQIAASDHRAKDRFLLYKDGASTTAHLLYEGETWDPSIPTITVELHALDDLVDAGKLRLPDFVKIDVEGHGHKAIAGAIRAIAASRPIILMGMHSPLEVAETEKLLLPLGYRFESVKPGAPADKVGWDYLLRPGGG
ncbi:MAG TPA: FkbM family methyltransferase [Opitutaceae bacterium]|nr:FkbM family methyltransferase [Opitutaceae bacterium]